MTEAEFEELRELYDALAFSLCRKFIELHPEFLEECKRRERQVM